MRTLIRQALSDPIDIWYYAQGRTRYWVYTRWPGLIRKHIREQYEWRKIVAAPCYRAGSCRCCGCRSPEVFFARKACSVASPKHKHCALMAPPCYPKLMGRKAWDVYKYTLESA